LTYCVATDNTRLFDFGTRLSDVGIARSPLPRAESS